MNIKYSSLITIMMVLAFAINSQKIPEWKLDSFPVNDIPASWNVGKGVARYAGGSYQTFKPFFGADNKWNFSFDTSISNTIWNTDVNAARVNSPACTLPLCDDSKPVPKLPSGADYNGQAGVITPGAKSFTFNIGFEEAATKDSPTVTVLPFSSKPGFNFGPSKISGFLGLAPNADTWDAIAAKYGKDTDLVSSIAYASKGDGLMFDSSQENQDMSKSSIIVGGRHYTNEDRTPSFYKVTGDAASAFVFINVEVSLTRKTPDDSKYEEKDLKGVKKNICVQTNNNFLMALDGETPLQESTLFDIF
jgi:hypothetical protein